MDKIKKTIQNNPKDRIEYEIGDYKQTEWQPQVKFMRWNNEVNLSVRQASEGTPNFYDVPEGHEFEVILTEKPKRNVVEFTIQTKGLDFFYQPPLTQKEIDEGAERPENVVGSYAVYHATKGGMNRADGMEYKTGKAFHIYRPKVIDANGVETWGELNIDEQNGLLTVTIDQTWLDNAVYPVVVDPTFGYTSEGASQQDVVDRMTGSIFNLSENGIVTEMAFWPNGGFSRPGNTSVYRVSDSVLMFQGTQRNDSWIGNPELMVIADESLSAGDYVLCFWADNNLVNLHYDTGDTGQGQFEVATFPTAPDPASFSSEDKKYSIYATYTASGGDATVNAGVQAVTASQPTPTVTTTKSITVSPNSQTGTFGLQLPTIIATAPSLTGYNSFKKDSLAGNIDLDSDDFKVALVTSSYIFDQDAHTTFDDITNEISGTGYTSGGESLTGLSVSQDNTNNRGVFDASNATWNNATFTARGAVIYKGSGVASTSPLVAFFDFGGDYAPSYQNFTIEWNNNGIVRFS